MEQYFNDLGVTPAELLKRQSLPLPGVLNARELGGYSGAQGRKVKRGLLLRTAALYDIPEESLRLLSEKYRVRGIADFRMPLEAEMNPDCEIPGAQYFNISVMNSGESQVSREEAQKIRAAGIVDINKIIEYASTSALKEMYSGILLSEAGRQGYAMFLRMVISCCGGAVVWHCSYGKDRSGLAAALLLYALGADDSTVMADFLLTNEVLSDNIAAMREKLRAQGCSEEIQAESVALAGVKGEYLASALEQVRAQYGSMDGYISSLGITDEDIGLLRDYYLEG